MPSSQTLDQRAERSPRPLRPFATLAVALQLTLLLQPALVNCLYRVGAGIADVTGPPAEVNFMGYANPDQKGQGIHLRQFSRAFVFEDETGSRFVFVSVDCGMIGNGLRKQVLRQLRQIFPGERYSERNVLLSGTHTHSTPGGFLMHILFDLTSWGFVQETFDALVEGIVQSIIRADASVIPARLFVGRTEVHGININRSPAAYANNPSDERNKYEYDTDHILVQLKIVTESEQPYAALHWFAVHPTSMNNSNRLISSDNLGYASVLFEQHFNGLEGIIGRGPFIGAFASSNLGDVSPNTGGARCEFSGSECQVLTSTCLGRERCIARGPGVDMFDSTAIIARRLFQAAWELWQAPDAHRELRGPVMVVHQFVDMPEQTAEYRDMRTGVLSQVRGCLPAMGYSFAAGTTDGVGAFTFRQGMRSENPLWNALRNFIAEPSGGQIGCHGAKPILLTTGEMNFPLQWQPTIVSTQLATLGDFAIACVPGEFTTMAGRRLRETVFEALRDGAKDGEPTPSTPYDVAVAGLCNTYSDYITTPEEYDVQRYEGASTIFGPHTLTLHLQQYKSLAQSLRNRQTPVPGPEPPELMNELVSLLPPVLFDTAVWSHEYGEVLKQPRLKYRPGETVRVGFVSSHPRNNPRRGDTFLTVERLERAQYPQLWTIVATDANWETKMIWQRVSYILGSSMTEVEWTVPDWTLDGVYRINYYGHYKTILGDIEPYNGTTYTFTVTRKPFSQ